MDYADLCRPVLPIEKVSRLMDTVEFGMFRPDRPGIRKVLGDLEAEVMEVIWARPANQGTTVREVFEILYERRRIAYTTVMSTMARLARKRLLRAEKVEAAYVYYPALSEEDFVSGFVGRILEDLLVSFSGTTIEQLQALATPDMAARAHQLVEAIRRRRMQEEEQIEGGEIGAQRLDTPKGPSARPKAVKTQHRGEDSKR